MVETDYLKLWHDLASRGAKDYAFSFNQKERAEAYESATQRKNRGRRDMLLDIVINDLEPGYTVLDIGAGTGRWTIPLAHKAARVTAVDPAGAMSEILIRNATAAGVREKIDLVPATWEKAETEVHDFVISFHSIYMSSDFASFIHKMEAHAAKRCYLGLRHFPIDGIIQALSTKIHGIRHDSPNFIIGYNALYQIGIYANVVIEEFQHPWEDETLETAFTRAKRHLRLDNSNTDHDTLIRDTLKQRLVFEDGSYHWPDSMTTAMVWWDVQNL